MVVVAMLAAGASFIPYRPPSVSGRNAALAAATTNAVVAAGIVDVIATASVAAGDSDENNEASFFQS